MPRPRPRSTATAEDILAPLSADVRALAEEIRGLVRKTVPEAEERANPGWVSIGYHDAQSGYFCGIFPRPPAVRLLFEHGAALPDPDGLLAGRTKQVRWIDLHPGEPIPRDGIRRLVEAALLHGAVR
ncbi:MAG TPA: DUF1801 domain-containing protein [Longimicrobium sp.]|nr:DUF1801 domain-containing protein [Longimicrobium sp.]